MGYRKRFERTHEERLERPLQREPEYSVYTDGGCKRELYNTSIGRGGYGIVIIDRSLGDFRGQEFSKGYKLTTNQRMELMAVIEALRLIPSGKRVRVTTDSKYVVKGIRGLTEQNENEDLWEQLEDELKKRNVDAVWVKGHNGHINNERCDKLVKQTYNLSEQDLFIDYGYIRKGYVLNKLENLDECYYANNTIATTVDELVDINHVTSKCAQSIFDFWNADERLPIQDKYLHLVSGGKDYWSDKRKKWFEDNIPNEIVQIVEEQFSDIPMQEKVFRWYMRGLSIVDALNKVGVDLEWEITGRFKK